MQDREHLYGIYQRYLDGQASSVEVAELFRYLNEGHVDDLRQLIETAFTHTPPAGWGASPEIRDILPRVKNNLAHVIEETKPNARKTRRIHRWLPYAAALALFALTIGWLLLDPVEKGGQRSDLPTGQAGTMAAADIAPGSNRATLTLADGTTVELSSEHEGIVIQDGITYLDGSQVMENEELRMKNDRPSEENAITTPKGGTYQVTLPDGSKVWLNAASTLRYPSRFSNEAREVFLEGEAYFDIQKQAAAPTAHRSVEAQNLAPFKVLTAGQVVQVLGTEFNISAYPDEDATKTTLVEGKVKVTAGTENGLTTHDPRLTTNILTPGQQATTRNAAITVKEVDTQPYIAWKDGYFDFTDADIHTIMREFARWYDIDVIFDGPQTTETFTGRIPRSWSLIRVTNMMDSFNSTQLTIEGRKVIVKQ